MLYRSDHLAAVGLDYLCRFGFERRSKGEVGGNEEPTVPTVFRDCPSGRICERIGVEHPLHRIRGTSWTGQIRAGGARRKKSDAASAQQLVQSQGDRGIRHIDDGI